MTGMATRKVLKSVLWNFLGTYMSRYSDYDGYWLFGFLIGDLQELRINALGQVVNDPDSALGIAIQSAAEKFKDQCEKAGLIPSRIREAWLTIKKLPDAVRGPVSGRPSDGYSLRFTAEAVTDGGRHYGQERTVFVAPHNPKVETRSARADKRRATPGHDNVPQ
jgi:hypothetical protein